MNSPNAAALKPPIKTFKTSIKREKGLYRFHTLYSKNNTGRHGANSSYHVENEISEREEDMNRPLLGYLQCGSGCGSSRQYDELETIDGHSCS